MIPKQFRDAVCRTCPHLLVWNKQAPQCCYEQNYGQHLPPDKRPDRVALDLLEKCPDPVRGKGM